ncbi:isochorismatase family protein [Aetokthonos hydrillicola Thurmond2011]|jgi:nicotinamidase-related amidase|uniref:Isochorismatase family protein n=1 Tax=Aetokthonos hydrillicola Thurmond2011 TaxID=2712845 RepID=A0AAP5I4B2_9CYAN|nr:isochorismatase family protein [Aetokthonos hydrillicola]MBO3459395.1 isochorismatase family protein [Aetokthonos hydrillicola CCALA 1050]MBW4586541.1 isochorismatase family protein [Aetokthonos hydrillicola CCALA 1050]MDR9893514.1 isochorismatase family protein [Aetokthonos hydrillicola Thurmond2011]
MSYLKINNEPITRDNAVMVFIDLQFGALSTIQSMDQQELKANAIALAKICKILNLPVIFAAADIPGHSGTFLPELTELLPNAIYIRHATNNSWETPEFVQAIERTERKYLIMTGLATDVGLCLPAISAVAVGYTVYAIIDVSGTLNARIEQAAWLRMMQAGVILTSWTAFTGEIQRSYTREPGAELRAVIAEHWKFHNGPF